MDDRENTSQPASAGIQLEDYMNPQVLDRFREYVAYIIEHRMVDEAFLQVRQYEALIKAIPEIVSKYPDGYQMMQQFILECKALSFPLLEGNEVVDLFGTHIGLVIDIHGRELWDKVRALMTRDYQFDERDELKKRILDALIRSQERITSKGPLLGGKEVTPTVENWIKDYISHVGLDNVDAFKRSEWLTRSPNITRLNEQEKIRVRMVMMLHDKLPISSMTIEGLEEVASLDRKGRPVLLREGRIEEMTPKEFEEFKHIITLAGTAIDKQYKEKREEEVKKLLEEKYRRWLQESYVKEAWSIVEKNQPVRTLEDSEKVMEKFYEGINNNNVSSVLSNLWMLAKAGKIRDSFRKSQRYQSYWQKHLPKKLAKSKDEFLDNSASQTFLLPFLRHVLVKRLHLDSEVAKIAVMVLANEARRTGENEYADLVFGDLKTGVYEWKDFTEHILAEQSEQQLTRRDLLKYLTPKQDKTADVIHAESK